MKSGDIHTTVPYNTGVLTMSEPLLPNVAEIVCKTCGYKRGTLSCVIGYIRNIYEKSPPKCIKCGGTQWKITEILEVEKPKSSPQSDALSMWFALNEDDIDDFKFFKKPSRKKWSNSK